MVSSISYIASHESIIIEFILFIFGSVLRFISSFEFIFVLKVLKPFIFRFSPTDFDFSLFSIIIMWLKLLFNDWKTQLSWSCLTIVCFLIYNSNIFFSIWIKSKTSLNENIFFFLNKKLKYLLKHIFLSSIVSSEFLKNLFGGNNLFISGIFGIIFWFKS